MIKPMLMVKNIMKAAKANSNLVLTVATLLGIGGTAVAVADATIKAVKVCEEKQVTGAREIVKTVWKLYLPSAGVIFLTTVAVLSNAKINAANAKKLATVTGLYAASQADFKTFKEKVREEIGANKTSKINEEIGKERIDKTTVPPESQIIKTGHGDQLFLEWLTGQYVRTSPEWIEAVEEKLNNYILKEHDNKIYGGTYLELLGMDTDCLIGETVWDITDMRINGFDKIKLDYYELKWKDINGKKEMVGILVPSPYPTVT